MSLKSRPDGLDQKLILMPQRKQSFCALKKITIFHPIIGVMLVASQILLGSLLLANHPNL
jgi:hypothetical protein